MAESDDKVVQAEAELEQARLSAEYDALNDAAHDDPENEDVKAQRKELAEKLVASRQEVRKVREAEAAVVMDGEGVAQPTPAEGTSEVN